MARFDPYRNLSGNSQCNICVRQGFIGQCSHRPKWVDMLKEHNARAMRSREIEALQRELAVTKMGCKKKGIRELL